MLDPTVFCDHDDAQRGSLDDWRLGPGQVSAVVPMASSLNESIVRHVTDLARLRLTGEQLACYTRQLSAVLEYMQQLNEVDTTDVPPMAYPLPIFNVSRQDTPQSSLDPDQALSNVPQVQNGFFQVPKVIDHESA